MSPQETIRWREWGTEAFEEARAGQKPVFLSISAVWCHWCHVLDEESFAHPEVIRRLNEDYIPIRVDSDRRPDINSRYNMGGWPTVAILDGRGDLKVGGTYMPPGQLLSMLVAGKDEPARPVSEGASVVRGGSRDGVDQSVVDTIGEFLVRAFDPDFGGFGVAPKFPQPWGVELAFLLHSRYGEEKWLRMARLTLDAMREGELYDTAEGGFFRYTTGGDWHNPHFEKLLEANAQMAALYLKAFNITGELTYRATAQGVLDYLSTVLASEEGPWFWGSQSADGEYYAMPDDEKIFAESPPVDCTIFADRNAMAGSALLMAGVQIGREDYLEKGLALVDFIWRHFFEPGRGFWHYDDGKLSLSGHLSDQVHGASALLDAYERSGNGAYLEQALQTVEVMNRHLGDSENGGFWDLPKDSGAEGILKVRIKPFSENAVAAMALTRLHYLTGREEYLVQARKVLEHLSTTYKSYKHYAAPFGVAVERFLRPPHHMTLVGNLRDSQYKALLTACHQVASPWRVVLPLDADRDGDRLKGLGYPAPKQATVYLCVGKTCLPPITQPDELSSAVTGFE